MVGDMNTSHHETGRTTVLVALAVAVVIALAGGAFWLLNDDKESEKFGDCADATYQLAVENEDSGLEVSFELQASQPGEDWYLRLMQDGDVLLEGPRTTDEDGELEVDAYAKEGDGDEFSVEFSRADVEDNCNVSLTH